jgi:hypothetical protein
MLGDVAFSQHEIFATYCFKKEKYVDVIITAT